MPDKSLTESAWKTFAKAAAGSWKDAALLKALAAFEKAEKGAAEDQLQALDELAKQADLVRKADKANKKLAEYLDGLDKALDKQRKLSEQALQAEKKAAATAGDEEEESPALLTTKLIPLLREVRKADTVLQALIAVAGKDTAVLLSRRAISPARGKLLKEYLGVSGGLKLIRGECRFEANAHTFIVQTQAAGLAKKLKAALLAQTDLRVKVRVRGEDPDDLDEDGEDGEDDEGNADGAAAGNTAAPPAPPPPQQLAFESRLAKLDPLVQRALQDQQGDVSRLRAISAFAREKGEAGAWAAGLQALDALQKLLDAGAPAAEGTAAPAAAATADGDPAAAFNARLAALMPRVKEAIAAEHPQAQDIKLKVSEAGVFARKKEFPRAAALLDDAQTLLDSAPATKAGGGDGPAVDRSKALKARLEALQGAIRAAMAGPLAAQLRPLVATVAAAKTDFDAADKALDAIEALLARQASDQAADAAAKDGADDSVGEAEWASRLAATEDRFNAVLAGNPADATRLRATMAYATEQAGSGNYADAVKALARLDGLLDAAQDQPDGGLPAEGVVEYRSALLAFKGAFSAVQSQLQALKSAIPKQLPDEAGLADELEGELQAFNDELQDAVDAAMTAAQNNAAPVTRDLADTLAGYRQQLADHALVRHVDGNPFGVKVSVAQLLGDALGKIVQTMPKVA